MNTIDEQIAILRAFKAGKGIEWHYSDSKIWHSLERGYDPNVCNTFNFLRFEYRIVEKTITLQCELTEKEANSLQSLLSVYEPIYNESLYSACNKLLAALKNNE